MKTADLNPQEDFDILVFAWTRGNLYSFMASHKYELMDRWYPITLRPAFWKTVESELSKEKLADALDAWFVNTGITDICTAAMGDQLVYLLIRKGWVFDWVSNDHSPFSIKIKNWLKKEGKEKILGLNTGINVERWWNRIFPPKEKIAATTNKEDDLEKFVRLWVKNPGLNVALNVADKNLDTWNLVTANPLFWKRLKEEMPISKLLETMSSWFGSSNTEISFPAMGRDLAISLIKNNVWMLSHVRNHKTDGDNFSRKIRNFLRKLGKEKTFSAFSHLFYPGVLEEFWEELFPEDNIKTSSGLLYTKEEYEEVLEIWELPYEEYLESIADFKSGGIGLFPKYKDMSSSPLFWKALRSKLSLKELAQKMGSWFGSDTEKANPFVWGDELAKEFILRVEWALRWTASEWRNDPMARSLRLFIKKKMTKEEIGEAPVSLGVYESVDELWEALFPKQEGRTASSKPKISSTLDLETQAEYSLMYLEAAWGDGDVEIAEFLEDNDWGAKETSDFLRRPGAVKAIKRLTSEGNEPYQRRRFLTILLSVVSRNPDMYVPLSQLDAIEVCYLYHVMARFFSLNVFNDLLISRVKARIRKLVKNKAEFRKTLIIYGISGRELEEDIFPENKTASSETFEPHVEKILKWMRLREYYTGSASEFNFYEGYSLEKINDLLRLPGSFAALAKRHGRFKEDAERLLLKLMELRMFVPVNQLSEGLLITIFLELKGYSSTDPYASVLNSRVTNRIRRVLSRERFDQLLRREGVVISKIRKKYEDAIYGKEDISPDKTASEDEKMKHAKIILRWLQLKEIWWTANFKTHGGHSLEQINNLLRLPGSIENIRQCAHYTSPISVIQRLIRVEAFVPISQLNNSSLISTLLLVAQKHESSYISMLRARISNRIKKIMSREEFRRLVTSMSGADAKGFEDMVYQRENNSAPSINRTSSALSQDKTSKYIQIPAPVLNQVSYIIKEKLKEVYKTDNQKETLSQIRFRPYSFSLDEEEVQNMPNPKGDLSIETLIIRFLLDPEATPEHPLLVGGEYRTTSEKGQPVEAEIDLYVNGSLTYEELIHHTASLEDFEYSQHIIEHELIHLYDKTTREKREEKERTDREYYNQPQEVRAYRANLIKEFELWVYEHQPKELDSKLLDSFLRESKFWRLNKWLYPENRRAFLKELGRRLHEYSTRTKEMAYGVSD